MRLCLSLSLFLSCWISHLDRIAAFAIRSGITIVQRDHFLQCSCDAPKQLWHFRLASSGYERYGDTTGKGMNSYMAKKWSNFQYGVSFVNSRYLTLFWEFNFRRPLMPWLLLIIVVLFGAEVVSPSVGSWTFDIVKHVCTAAFFLAGIVGGILQVPFDAVRWAISLAPSLVVPVLDHLPSKLAIQMVKILLDIHSGMNYLAQTTFLTGATVLFWRPIVEEIQYRYILGKLLGKGTNTNNLPVNEERLVQFIPVDGSDDVVVDVKSEISKVSNSTLSILELRTGKQESRRLLLASIAFALTRLGWLCSSPTTVDFAHPFLQTAKSPYSWTVAFIQSAMAHFSSRALSEISPLIQRLLLILAVQQTASTFLVTWYVFVPLYLERGILASIGAHIAWTIGKMTWPIRLMWRLMTRI